MDDFLASHNDHDEIEGLLPQRSQPHPRFLVGAAARAQDPFYSRTWSRFDIGKNNSVMTQSEDRTVVQARCPPLNQYLNIREDCTTEANTSNQNPTSMSLTGNSEFDLLRSLKICDIEGRPLSWNGVNLDDHLNVFQPSDVYYSLNCNNEFRIHESKGPMTVKQLGAARLKNEHLEKNMIVPVALHCSQRLIWISIGYCTPGITQDIRSHECMTHTEPQAGRDPLDPFYDIETDSEDDQDWLKVKFYEVPPDKTVASQALRRQRRLQKLRDGSHTSESPPPVYRKVSRFFPRQIPSTSGLELGWISITSQNDDTAGFENVSVMSRSPSVLSFESDGSEGNLNAQYEKVCDTMNFNNAENDTTSVPQSQLQENIAPANFLKLTAAEKKTFYSSPAMNRIPKVSTTSLVPYSELSPRSQFDLRPVGTEPDCPNLPTENKTLGLIPNQAGGKRSHGGESCFATRSISVTISLIGNAPMPSVQNQDVQYSGRLSCVRKMRVKANMPDDLIDSDVKAALMDGETFAFKHTGEGRGWACEVN